MNAARLGPGQPWPDVFVTLLRRPGNKRAWRSKWLWADRRIRLVATDAEIFAAFYREHVDAIQGFVARRVGERERAADLTAEIFFAAIGAAHRYRPGRVRSESRHRRSLEGINDVLKAEATGR